MIVVVNFDTGGKFGTMTGGVVTVMDFVEVVFAPRLSVTVKVIVYVPALVYVWDDVMPLELALESPQLH